MDQDKIAALLAKSLPAVKQIDDCNGGNKHSIQQLITNAYKVIFKFTHIILN